MFAPTPLEWIFAMTCFSMYIFCIFTVCLVTFQKGRWVLGILGIFFPFLWLIGAVLPAKEGSRYAVSEGIRRSEEMRRYTS
jgi:hypothetical protein